MRHCFIIINLCRYLSIIFPVKMTEHIFITFITGSKNYKLDCILTKFIHNICDQIKTFLICQTGYDTNHHGFWIFLKSKVFLKLNFIFYLFFSECSCVICLCDIWICLRVEYVIINTIYDSSQAVSPCTHKTIQFFTIKWCFNLFCICITYSGDCISKYDTTFQIVGIFICLKFICCEIVI